ncbi:hypothetical protein [Stenotrophomonas sp. PS02300]|uniref:hypothetical protein n=1 Tax=Stenotrophomonas sp. PS02300 TaxID=2991426 RepID=UPI00249B590B|nr:hypothetical protein [Stenotrophomonas sp. PS02300]
MKLYHYTDVSAVHSILSTRKLWLTDLRFMNDSQELLHGIDFLQSALKQQPYGLFYNKHYAEQAVEYLASSLSKYEDAARFDDPVFAMSFSEKDDLLSQWRGYGGYSVCFNREYLEDCGLKLSSCLYTRSSKLNRALVAASDAGARVSSWMGRDHGCIGLESIDQLISLVEFAATFKDAGFEEEREVRMIARPNSNEIKYRPRNGILVPYVEIDIPAEAIEGVCIGPVREQGLASVSMEMFISSVESINRSNGGNIGWCVPVGRSNTPYRS